MFGFGKNEKPAALPQSPEARLKAQFAHSVFGHFCRTVSYEHPTTSELGHTHWREALYMPTEKGWYVFDVLQKPMNAYIKIGDEIQEVEAATKSKNATIISKLKRTQVGRHAMSFFEVVENLAVYENGQQALGYTLADEKEKQALGNEHFVALAHREAIAFDSLGMPHPTESGHIVTDAEFSVEEDALVQKNYKKKQKTLRDSAGLSFSGVLSADAFQRTRNSIEAMDNIKSHLSSLVKDKDYDTASWYYLLALQGKANKGLQDKYRNEYDAACVVLNNTTALFTKNKQIEPSLYRNVYMFKFLFLAKMAAFTQDHINRKNCSHSLAQHCSEKTKNIFLQAAENALKECGLSEAPNQETYRTYREFLNFFEDGQQDEINKRLRKIVNDLGHLKSQYESSLGIGSVQKQLLGPEKGPQNV